MKYIASIDEQTYEIVVQGDGRILVDGVDVTADMQRLGRQDLYSLLIDHASHEVVIESDAGQHNQYAVLVAGARYLVKVQDERSRRLALADRGVKVSMGELAIKPPIPGLVVKVLVNPDQAVSEGEPLIILEAMKMENELRSPRAGVVHEVRVAAGEQVSLDQILVTIK